MPDEIDLNNIPDVDELWELVKEYRVVTNKCFRDIFVKVWYVLPDTDNYHATTNFSILTPGQATPYKPFPCHRDMNLVILQAITGLTSFVKDTYPPECVFWIERDDWINAGTYFDNNGMEVTKAAAAERINEYLDKHSDI